MYVHAYYTHVYCMCVCYRTYIICTVVHVYMCIFMSINVCACVFGSVGGGRDCGWIGGWVLVLLCRCMCVHACIRIHNARIYSGS